MRILACSSALLLATASPVAGQSLDAGVSFGVVKLTDARSEQALTGIVEYHAGGLACMRCPPFARVDHDEHVERWHDLGVEQRGRRPAARRRGLVCVAHPGAPTLGAALLVVLPTGNASCGLGNGQAAAGVDLGAGVSPGRAHLSADVSRSISGVSSQSTLDAPRATTLRFEAGYDAVPRWTWTASLGVDVGTTDSTHALSRVIGVGVNHTLAGALALTLDGSRGLTSGSPQWVFSLGLGTAYGGSSPVMPTTPLRRLRTTFSSGARPPAASSRAVATASGRERAPGLVRNTTAFRDLVGLTRSPQRNPRSHPPRKPQRTA